jgi:hypothetical protein
MSSTDGDEVSAESTPGKNCWSRSSVNIQLPSDHPLWAEQARFCADIDRFEEIASSVLNCFSEPRSNCDHEFYAASIIQIQMEMSKLRLAYCFCPPAISWDDYLPSFRRILSLTASIVPYIKNVTRSLYHSSSSLHHTPNFKIDVGFLPALSMTVNLCRFKHERQTGLQILESLADYKEGIWDAHPVYGIARWITASEEPWRDAITGNIPAERRMEFESAEIDTEKRSMTARGWQGDGSGVRMEKKEGFLTW